MNGFFFLKKIKEEKPNQKCIFFTMYSEYSYLKKAIHEDIGGYVLKNNDPSELIMCVNQVVDGKKYYSNEVSQVLLNVQNTPEHVRINNLYNRKISARELQVLKYISKQFTNEEIAEKLFLSKRTIDTYRQRLLEKLGVKNTAGLVKFVYDNQIEIP